LLHLKAVTLSRASNVFTCSVPCDVMKLVSDVKYTLKECILPAGMLPVNAQ